MTGLCSLPKLKKVIIPTPLSGKHFGDIVMVSEFIDTFKNFLQTEEDFPLKTGIMSYFNSLLLQFRE